MFKNRKLLLQVTAPAIVIGLLLLGSCLISSWYINRLQANLAHILGENVTSLEAAQELETRVRQLRFHAFLYLIDPDPARQKPITNDQKSFVKALGLARRSAHTPNEIRRVEEIEAGYEKYLAEMNQLRQEVARSGPRIDYGKLSDAHPIRHVVDPCLALFTLNKEKMKQIAQESESVTREATMMMIIIGVLGPVGGVFMGYGVSRILSRSIYQLSVRVHDMAQQLDQDVASVSVAVDGDIETVDRQLDHILNSVQEVGERLQKHQREMLRAEQLAAVGQLAASVAHEVRNPLTAVKMLIDAARRPQNAKPLSSEDLTVIHGEIVRLEHSVQDFLDFARLPTPKRTVCDVRDVIAQAVELVQARARQQRVQIDVQSPATAILANLDRNQICTVLINLFLNALDAMPHGGRLGVTLDTLADQMICLAVEDSGDGIAPEMAARLFTPFTSTKPTGTGLGLSICRRIIDEHGGSIRLDDSKSAGARFRMILPGQSSEQEVIQSHGHQRLEVEA